MRECCPNSLESCHNVRSLRQEEKRSVRKGTSIYYYIRAGHANGQIEEDFVAAESLL